MPMSKDELFDIFREYASEEFTGIPLSDDDIDYKFSKKFERRMLKLFEDLRNNTDKKSFSISRRKTIAILIAAIIILMTGVMSVGAVREPIVNFVVEKYEGFMDFIFKGDTSNKIEYVYSFNPVPQNFEETNKSINENTVYTEYVNTISGDEIILEQRITDGTQGSWDTQNGETSTIMSDNTLIYLYKHNTAHVCLARWIKDKYSFTLTYYGEISEKQLIELIKNII